MESTPHVVILGSTGTIGAALASHLQVRGVRFQAVGREQCDLEDPLATLRLFQGLPAGSAVVFTAVINRWKEDSFPALQRNLTMAENIALAAAERACAMVFLSSVDVYGRHPPTPIREDTPVLPESYYAIAKHASELLLARALPAHCPLTILRLPGVYGKDGRERSVLGSFLKKVMFGEPITIFGDGSILRDFVFVDDVCALVHEMVRTPRPGIHNVATGTSLPIQEVVSTLGRVLAREPIVQFAPANDSSAGNLVFDTAGLRVACPSWAATPLAVGSALLADRIRR
jgi:nucleoside-diphosphate-sugar epimerase